MPIVHNTNDEYHSSEGVSKSGLWELYDKTPYHHKFIKRKESVAFDFGQAAHIAILEPHLLESSVTKGPADRRGNKWKDAVDFAEHNNMILLTEGDYEQIEVVREVAASIPQIQVLQSEAGAMREVSAYHNDEETDILVRCRPDIYSPKYKLIGDIKTAASAAFGPFQRSIGSFGYHVQEAVYTDTWSKGAEMDVDGFFFIVFEKSDPPMVAVYELDINAVTEGHAIYRKALKMYKECLDTGEWPGYPKDVQTIGLKNWDYRETTPAREEG